MKYFNFRSFNSSILCIPIVWFPGLAHPGIVGTAPLIEILNIWSERERKLIETSHESLKLCGDLYQKPLANLPTSENCLVGKAIFLFSTRRAVFSLSSARGFGYTGTARTARGSINAKARRGTTCYLPFLSDHCRRATRDYR